MDAKEIFGPLRIARLIIGPNDLGQDFQIVLRVTAPGQEPAVNRANFTANRRRQRYFSLFVGFQVAQEGEIAIELELNGQHQASHLISVTRLLANQRSP